MTIGERIKHFRKLEGLTQAELGAKMGVSQAAVVQFEKATSSLKIETVRKIAGALGVSMSVLLEGTEVNYNNVAKDANFISKDIVKKLVLVKFLDCILGDCCLTRVNILEKGTNNHIYTDEYISIKDKSYNSEGEITLDEENIKLLLDIIENLCKKIVSVNGKKPDYSFYSNPDHKYEFLEEYIDISSVEKEKFSLITEKEWNNILVQNLKNSAKEEFVVEEPKENK